VPQAAPGPDAALSLNLGGPQRHNKLTLYFISFANWPETIRYLKHTFRWKFPSRRPI